MTLALAVANLTSRIRSDGLSSREIWSQRDQVTGEQLPIDDRLILNQSEARKNNHGPSASSKLFGRRDTPTVPVSVGDLVFLKGDKSKLRARERYLVIEIDSAQMCPLRKFSSSQFRKNIYTVPMCKCYQPLSHPLTSLLDLIPQECQTPDDLCSDDEQNLLTKPLQLSSNKRKYCYVP